MGVVSECLWGVLNRCCACRRAYAGLLVGGHGGRVDLWTLLESVVSTACACESFPVSEASRAVYVGEGAKAGRQNENVDLLISGSGSGKDHMHVKVNLSLSCGHPPHWQ